MAITIDTSGLSCPQPVLMFLAEVKKDPNADYDVLVDNDASEENVTRAAHSRGYEVKPVKVSEDQVRLEIRRKQ